MELWPLIIIRLTKGSLCLTFTTLTTSLPDYHGSQNSHILVSKATRTCVQGGLTNVEWKNIKTVAAMTKCLQL